jgi:hypothetical protein
MSSQALLREVDGLLAMLGNSRLPTLGAIPWASPVISFGSPLTSTVATVGLNPSNLEFVDAAGVPLEPHNRFETLRTLKLHNWSRRATDEVQKVWWSCENYFRHRPYDRWFKPLDRVLAGLGVSYYSQVGSACHLDLVPFATDKKWSSLDSTTRSELIVHGLPSLIRTIKASNVRVLVLNGASVLKTFEQLVDGPALHKISVPKWTLCGGTVSGYAASGRVSSLRGMDLGREVLVVGFNHNIQSSFGVTREVVQDISRWVGTRAIGMLA